MKKAIKIFAYVITYLFVGVIVPILAVGGVFRSEPADSLHIDLKKQEFNSVGSEADWQTFRSEDFGFEIRYPTGVKKQTAFPGKVLNASVGKDLNVPVWKFSLEDKAYYKDTNLIDASIVIHVLHGVQDVATCSEIKPGSIYQTPERSEITLPVVEVNGIPFWKDEVKEGAMGRFYRRIIYRTISNDACYEITQFIRTQNVESFAPGEIDPYPEGEVIDVLDRVLNTFTVLDSSPTFPKQEPPTAEPEMVVKSLDGASGEYADGIDVSHWQGDINWTKVYNAGYRFAFVKATEGVGFTDWYFHKNTDEGTDAGVLMGAYHFARPDLNNTGEEEAEYFLSIVGDYIEAGYLRPVLDIEVSGGKTKSALSSWVVDWMETVKNKTGVEPLIYTNYYFIRERFNDTVANYDLWIAYWNCDPTPTVSIPPTEKFADWDFWQYQAPGGCGNYSIPGVEGNVDLDIFNGGETELSTFESDAPLWVSLDSYSYYAPRPNYADLIADVNGSAVGPIDYYFWWNCNHPGTDVAEVEDVCGVLPTPDSGQCRKDEIGMRCRDALDENMMAEHTYDSIGKFMSKVIVHRGEVNPAEDRYLITTFNPIVSIEPRLTSPEYAFINQRFDLSVDVFVKTSIQGALQVEVIEEESGVLIAQKCEKVSDDVRIKKMFDLSWSESEVALKKYTIWARYRDKEECPVGDTHEYDRSVDYSVYWGIPVMGIERPEGRTILKETSDLVGDQKTSINHQLIYHITNTTGTTKLKVSNLTTTNLENIAYFSLNSELPVEILPGEGDSLILTYRVETIGPFDFTLNIENNDPNQNPFHFSILGTGISPFEDVSEDHWAYDAIEDLYQSGFTLGCSSSPLSYCPDDAVTRAEAAVFIERGVHGSSFIPPDVSPSFSDTAGHWAEDWIEALSADGITAGCGNGKYCPNMATTRAQMAVFLMRAKYGVDYNPPEATGLIFKDVSQDHWAADWIEQLAKEGITVGCGNGRYCPNTIVTRAQMAVFIDKTFQINP